MDIIELAEYGVIVENNPVVVDENIYNVVLSSNSA